MLSHQKQWKTNAKVTAPLRSVLHRGETLIPSWYADSRYELPSENISWIWPEQHVARILAETFKKIPQVKSVCAQFASDGFTVWTLLESRNPEARERIYEKELEICEGLNLHDFDFRVTSIDLVSPAELIRTGFVEIFSR